MAKYKFYENKYFQGIVFGNEQFFKRMKKDFGNAKKVFSNKKEAQKFNKSNFADLVKKYPNFMSLTSFEDNQGIFLNNLSRFEKVKSSNKNIATDINWNEENKLNAFIAKAKSKKEINNEEKDKTDISSKDNNEVTDIDKTSLFEDEKNGTNDKSQNNNKKNNKTEENILDDEYQCKSADIIVYTDGSVRKISKNGKGNVNLSTFIINDLIDNKKVARAIELGQNKLNTALKSSFNNRVAVDLTKYSELVAIESALEYLINKEKNCENIIIVTDSNDALITLDKALNGNYDSLDFINDLLKDIVNNMKMFNNLKFKLIKGHNKVYGNVLADEVKYFV